MPDPIPSTPRDSRDERAQQQAALIRAIHDRDPASAGGLDLSKLQVTAESLWRKRMRSIQKAWPATSRGLGERFSDQFELYAAEYSTPDNAGLDGYQFACWLHDRQKLPDDARVELMRRQLARGRPLRVAWLRRSRCVLIGYRWFGVVRMFRM